MAAITPILLDGYLKLPDIPGESRRDGHEGEIAIHRLSWQVARDAAAAPGSGRRRARAEVGPLVLDKFYDAASPHLALAAMRGRSFAEAVLSVRKSTQGAEFDYLVITLSNVAVAGYEMLDQYNDVSEPIRLIPERLVLTFERMTIRYVEETEDHAAGAEHEVEFDVSAGA